ncbi:DUF3265 domain-containing protein [Vibrio harveyi]|uniref:DUF3265 domain-containing protein n=1 Tax=Vibrio harveyi TaxID=669 RepID=A0A8B3D9N8_VIBHA|nr:DUF3265 domain-containing protein [Vibrio harveyi]RIW02232.1 DUF3265 domain-containing protein [Vibrio harveyi]
MFSLSTHITNCSRGIRNAWHFCYALRLVFKVACGSTGIAGGAIAGLACGPGAPVCVSVGAFIGGTLAAFGASIAW